MGEELVVHWSKVYKLNFISPYIELPKKLTVRQNLIVYGKLYDVKKLNEKIDYLQAKKIE